MVNMDGERIETVEVSPPENLEDFVDITRGIKESGGKLPPFGLPPETLAGVYAVAHLPGHRDMEIISLIDRALSRSTNADANAATKAVFAYVLASDVWGKYVTWGRDYEADKSAQQELGRKIRDWTIEGLKSQPNNNDLRLSAIYIGSRITVGESFIRKIRDKRKIEKELGETISIRSIPDIEERLKSLTKVIDATIKASE